MSGVVAYTRVVRVVPVVSDKPRNDAARQAGAARQ
jgi:hypothetical protein